jgi:adenosylcobinamide kinase / adenosylcobinamide-phosphate guanylyltransferase
MLKQTNAGVVGASSVARSEFIIGGQRSGKSAYSEQAAAQWLVRSASHRAVYVATAQAHDVEMAARIGRHQTDRAARVPTMVTIEEPVRLADTLLAHSAPKTIVVIDCLTLWLTNLLMPHPANLVTKAVIADAKSCASSQRVSFNVMRNSEENINFSDVHITQYAMFLEAIKLAQGPVVVVSNEIGLGVIPLGREVRAYVDALGRLNQDVARACHRVTLMTAGLPLVLKGEGQI